MRIFISSVRDLTPSLYASLRDLNLRKYGCMRSDLSNHRCGYRRDRPAEVAVLMDQFRPLSWALWYERYGHITPGQIQVYTRVQFRRNGYGTAVARELFQRHPHSYLPFAIQRFVTSG